MTQVPIVFIPTVAVTAQSTDEAVGGIWQSVIIPRKGMTYESTIKKWLYYDECKVWYVGTRGAHLSAFRKGAEFLTFSLAHSCF